MGGRERTSPVTDIKIPVSAPGANAAAANIDKATEAARKLLGQKIATAKGIKEFNDQLDKEAKLLDGKVTPALKKAREEARLYDSLMSRGRLSQGRSFLAGSSLGQSDGGGGMEAGTGRGILRGLSRVGGPLGPILNGFGAAAGAAGVALGVFTAGAVVAGIGIRRWLQEEERRLAAIAEETKIRIDLNRTLLQAKEGQEDRASSSYENLRDSRRTIAALSTTMGDADPYKARGRIAQLEALGDPKIIQAMASFMKSRKGQNIGFEGGLSMAQDIAGTGAMSIADALGEMAKSKSKVTVDSIVAQGFGQRGRGSRENTAALTDNVNAYWDLEGFGQADDLAAQVGQAGMTDGRNMSLVIPAFVRQLDMAIDPVGVASEKFTKALYDGIAPLEARAAAENELLREYKETYSWLTGIRSERQLAEDERRKIAGGTR